MINREQTPNIANGHPPTDARAFIAGCVFGAFAGIALGLIIMKAIAAGQTIASLLIVFHVTLAMTVMGAWVAPSLLSNSDKPREHSDQVVTRVVTVPNSLQLESPLKLMKQHTKHRIASNARLATEQRQGIISTNN